MYIYKITHKSTHQAYIGQTKNLLERWRAHIVDTRSPIQKAISDEGIASFTFEVIEECSEENADSRESFWIHYYHAYEAGYNTNSGKCDSIEQFGNATKPAKAESKRSSINSPDGVDAYDPKTG